MTSQWRARAAATFTCEKTPATGRLGMVVSNHPLASAAGAEMLAGGGNAIDAAIATLFTLTVVEPMMIGLIGGGMTHLRLADGSHRIVDGQARAPLSVRADTYRSKPGSAHDVFDTINDENLLGPKAVAAPGSLKAWCEMLERFGTMSLADVMQPAIKHAARGFGVTSYLHDCISDAAADLARDRAIAARFLPDGAPLAVGARLVQADYAEALTQIAREGADALYRGALGRILTDYMRATSGFITQADLDACKTVDRAPIRAAYRDWEILGPPPPAASGVHIAQMLNILEHYDVAAMGFGTPDAMHLLAEVLKIAFADRAAATADPDFIDVPVARLIAKDYAAERQAAIDMTRAQAWRAGVPAREGAHTTHITVADAQGNVVAATQTINNLFGAKILIPGLGMIPNNYMNLFDPRPGHALSVAPGKRITTSMAPMMALQGGQLRYALGLPGGKRIFPSAFQALVNLIDHGMSLQEAVEAPRLWTEGNALEIEAGYGEGAYAALAARGHRTAKVPTVAGGMNGIAFAGDGSMTGCACWRADGVPVGLSGGYARKGVRFTLETPQAAPAG